MHPRQAGSDISKWKSPDGEHSLPDKSRIELHSLVHDLADNTDDDSVDTIKFVGEEDSDVDDTEGKSFAEPQDCSTTTICLPHKHGSLSAGVFAEKRKVSAE